MAQQYDNSNRGALFKDEHKAKPEDRDYSGSINIGGTDYWLSGWVKTSQKGAKFLSLSVKPKRSGRGQTHARRRNPVLTARPQNALERRRQLLATGYPSSRCTARSRRTRRTTSARSLTGWEQLGDITDEMLVMWSKTWPDAQNTGILTRTMPTLDLDILNEEAARALEDHVREQYEEKGPILVRIGKPPKRAIPFRTIEPFAKFVVNLVAPNGSDEKIEFLGRRRAGRRVRHPSRDQATLSLARRRAGRDQARGAALHPRRGGASAGRRAGADPGRALRLHPRQGAAGQAQDKGNGQDADEADRTSAPADWQFLIDNILAGRALHDSLRDLAAKMVKSGMDAGAAVNSLRAMMDAAQAPHDDRWKERYDEIPRLVGSARGLIEAPEPAAPTRRGRRWRSTTRSRCSNTGCC